MLPHPCARSCPPAESSVGCWRAVQAFSTEAGGAGGELWHGDAVQVDCMAVWLLRNHPMGEEQRTTLQMEGAAGMEGMGCSGAGLPHALLKQSSRSPAPGSACG